MIFQPFYANTEWVNIVELELSVQACLCVGVVDGGVMMPFSTALLIFGIVAGAAIEPTMAGI